MNGDKKKDLPAFISDYIVASSERVVFIRFNSVMFIVKAKLCFWNVVFFDESEINLKNDTEDEEKVLSQNLYMVHQYKICGLGALVLWGFLCV